MAGLCACSDELSGSIKWGGICRISEELSVSQVGLCSMGLVGNIFIERATTY